MLTVTNCWPSFTLILRVSLLFFLIADECGKVRAQLEQANKALTRELEVVKSTLSQTEQTLKTVAEEKTIYHEHIVKTSNTLMSTFKGLLGVLKKVTDTQVQRANFLRVFFL